MSIVMPNGTTVGSSVAVGKDESVIATPKHEKWKKLIPFSGAWREHRKAQKAVAEAVKSQTQVPIEQVPRAKSPPAQVTATQVTATQGRPEAIAAVAVVTRTETVTQPQAKKSLVHYPHHDNRGAVGQPPMPQPAFTPYPSRTYIGGGRVLAQYGHHDDKWAVGQPLPSQPVYTPYPMNTSVGGKRVLAQYGHHDDKWAVKHPVY
ncbi:hypothetical protein GP486_006173 [Trichoglossum hirsutum]|uniref:Uncharacterized protein n=1 Tax=Trichoglossum hirsutum TaxID=265104 RepID=A0A9P8IHM4_9PEZI|nr:hypothetical protein GP486_006173 [Trichoglossum hirsutum]